MNNQNLPSGKKRKKRIPPGTVPHILDVKNTLVQYEEPGGKPTEIPWRAPGVGGAQAEESPKK